MARSGTTSARSSGGTTRVGERSSSPPRPPGGCWADASVVLHSTSGDRKLRAGQVVELDWTEVAAEGLPFSAVRVVPREDLQQTVGG